MALTDEEMDVCRGIGEKAEKVYSDMAHLNNVAFATFITTLLGVWLDHHVHEENWEGFIKHVSNQALTSATQIKKQMRGRLQ